MVWLRHRFPAFFSHPRLVGWQPLSPDDIKTGAINVRLKRAEIGKPALRHLF
jgi:hypothetical protein